MVVIKMVLVIKACETSGVLNAIYIIKMVTKIIFILVPIIIILTSMISLFKAIITDDGAKINDAGYVLLSKIIVGAIVFMIPIMIDAIISLIDKGKVANSYLACYTNATAEKIKEYKEKEAAEAKAEAEAKEKEKNKKLEEYEKQQQELDKNNHVVTNPSGDSNNNSNSTITNGNFNNVTSGGTTTYGSGLSAASGGKDRNYNGINYYEVIPPNPKKNMPLIIFLHGSGENGNLSKVKTLPIVKKVTSGSLYGSGEYFFIAPASPSGSWYENGNASKIIGLIDAVANEYAIDKDRIYINGFSAGAVATWKVVNNNPNYFAAAAPIACCGDGVSASNFKTTPIWAMDGSNDNYVSCMSNLVNSINNSGGIARFDILQGQNHSGTQTTYPTQELITWMLSKKKAR